MTLHSNEGHNCPPVLLIVFNRPETTRRVFDSIRHARPERLYVCADGPRKDRPGEALKVAEARRIATAVDWPCELKTFFREDNVGCRLGVSQAVTWLMENEESGIILEDDCLPDPSFFGFCWEILERYKVDDRIMHVNGWLPVAVDDSMDYSYTFSRFPHVWGWATWRRAWSKFSLDAGAWEKSGYEFLLKMFGNRRLAMWWTRSFERVYVKGFDTWDYQWVLSCWLNGGLSVTPMVNLVWNIGFGAEATHTTDGADARATIEGGSIEFPLTHPTSVERNAAWDLERKEKGQIRDEWLHPWYKARSLAHYMFRNSPSAVLTKLQSRFGGRAS